MMKLGMQSKQDGIKKISFINFLFRFSFLFVILQLILNILIVPYTQNLGRTYLKNSNIDFLPTLISEKKFINVFKIGACLCHNDIHLGKQ